MNQAKLFLISKSDTIKAFIMLLFGTVTAVVGDAVMQAISTGDYALESIHWKAIGASVVVSCIAYIQKQFLTNSNGEFLKKETPKEEAK